MTVKKKKTEQTPTIPIQMVMELLTEKKKKIKPIPTITIPMETEPPTERMIFPEIPMKTPILTEVEQETIPIPMMTMTAFLMRKRSKTVPIPKILIRTTMAFPTVKKSKMVQILTTPTPMEME